MQELISYIADIESANLPDIISFLLSEPPRSREAISVKQANLADSTERFR